MISLLLDAWILRNACVGAVPAIEALQNVMEEVRARRATLARYLSPDSYFAVVQPAFKRYRTLGRFLSDLFHVVELNRAAGEGIEILAPGDLDAQWRSGFERALSPVDWRQPVVVTPVDEERIHQWNQRTEVEFRALDKLVQCRVIATGAVVAGSQDHPYYRSDMDPWMVGETLDVEFNHNARRELPRPPLLSALIYSRLTDAVLETERQRQGNRVELAVGNQVFFLPPSTQGWTALSVEKTTWRNGRAFPWGQKSGSGNTRYSGPLDYLGRVWWWDAEGHWDVQHPDARELTKRWRVTTDGDVVKVYD